MLSGLEATGSNNFSTGWCANSVRPTEFTALCALPSRLNVTLVEFRSVGLAWLSLLARVCCLTPISLHGLRFLALGVSIRGIDVPWNQSPLA